ncbi:MAG: DUF6448 family protein [Acidobacteriia bacterium]|nr:DUF6448 family protein [Terriglobia bacterium]
MKTMKRIILAALILSIPLVIESSLYAHCDTLDGPVVAAAKLAIQKGDITPVLKWVNKDGEKEVREAFSLTMKVRSQGEDAQRLADTFFFETLVRVHRSSEGVPYTGLKPAGSIEPVILAADKSLQQGSVDGLAGEVAKLIQEAIRARFAKAVESKKHADESVEAGRAYVEAYVDYIHFVEAMHSLAREKAGEQHQLHEVAAKQE